MSTQGESSCLGQTLLSGVMGSVAFMAVSTFGALTRGSFLPLFPVLVNGLYGASKGMEKGAKPRVVFSSFFTIPLILSGLGFFVGSYVGYSRCKQEIEHTRRFIRRNPDFNQ
eukprot:TRINITY_DN3285_c1_g1_i1.p1 TRINITY_DN3285_c1_g1~~TRINITY_DN3285_c1_g1_i1.p1  ORF type:complete len:112 (-),score=5.34 TRINITY_DN3285_c1_g1_i1:153-488(-)